MNDQTQQNETEGMGAASGLSAGLCVLRYSDSKKRGCPTCDGNDPKSCLRCGGKTRMCDWTNEKFGWTHNAKLTGLAPGKDDQ